MNGYELDARFMDKIFSAIFIGVNVVVSVVFMNLNFEVATVTFVHLRKQYYGSFCSCSLANQKD